MVFYLLMPIYKTIFVSYFEPYLPSSSQDDSLRTTGLIRKILPQKLMEYYFLSEHTIPQKI